MALTDAALERPELDAERSAALGGSFGGYMVNWMAGHTDRFRALITHAGIWDLPQFSATSDLAQRWATEFSPSALEARNPSRHTDAIRTPVLVIHEDRTDACRSLRRFASGGT